MLENINEALLATKDEAVYVFIDMETLKANLNRIRTAFINHDVPVINEIAKHLKDYTHYPGIGDDICTILQYKLSGEYDEAVPLIDNILCEKE
jgi:hypothetical protein